MTKILSIGLLLTAISINTLKAQNFPANGEIVEEIAIGGPSIDYKDLAFPRPGVTQCDSFINQTRTISGDIDAYGKTLLVVIFPKDCPYCINAANAAEPIIAQYRDDITLWYANQRLNGDGSCEDITELGNEYDFVKNADFKFLDVHMWNNEWNSSWHYGSQDSYWARKESPSVYRVFNPKTKKVTAISYYLGPIENELIAAIADNKTEQVTHISSAHDRVLVYPNPVVSNLYINVPTNAQFIVHIYNSKGVLVKSVENSLEISVSNLASGMYVIHYISNRVTFNEKIQVEK